MIHLIIGTRAQIIKMAPVMKELESREINYNFIFLAQHKETIYEIIDQFEIKKPDIVIGDINKDITNVKDMIIWSLRIIKYTIANHSKIFKNEIRVEYQLMVIEITLTKRYWLNFFQNSSKI